MLPPPNTLPTGFQLTAGAAAVSSLGNTLTVTESSQRAAINWQSFSIGSAATVNFVQPNTSAVILNRVVGSEQSLISGALNASGQVFLLNSNGVLFTQGASVNTGGLVASTLNISDSDFMAGRSTFASTGSNASVINLATLNAADGGYVALLGNQVSTQGVISARLGTAILAAGNNISLNFNGNSLVGVTINQGTLNALVENKQAIYADGGTVILTAQGLDSVLASAVNNTGEIRAQTVANQAGKIYLLGDMQSGTVNAGGTLDASAPVPATSASVPSPTGGGLGRGSTPGVTTDAGANGGFIETSAAHVNIANNAHITTAAASGLNGSWLIDPVDFTIAATGGNITGTALSTALGINSVTIQTASGGTSCTGATCTAGSTGANGDINVNDTVTWSAHTLTLNAYNNININTAMNGSGTAGLALLYGQGAVASGNLSTYNVNAPVNLATTGSFSTKLGSDGSVNTYTIVDSLGVTADATTAPTTMTLQGMAATASLAGKYVLGSNIDASAIANFTPIGNSTHNFTGIFDGLGHIVSSLTINLATTSNVGLFGYTAAGSEIQNVGLVGGSIKGLSSVGGLIGLNYGTVSNSYATGSVSGANNRVGGLVGASYGMINNSYATGNITGHSNVGGLAGFIGSAQKSGTISNSYATGSVTGTGYGSGGLVGYLGGKGTTSNSYATGSVTGSASGQGTSGGLAGYGYGTATNVYATGKVSGSFYVGGLIGVGKGSTSISNGFATGSVSGTGTLGGLMGLRLGSISNSYWDSSINPTLHGIGSGSTTGATGLTTVQMQTASNFVGFTFTTTPGASGNNWVMVDTNGTLNNAGSTLGATFPMLASEYATTINNAHQLQLMVMALGANYTLGSNIDASNTATATALKDVWNTTGGFVPIGNSTTPFTGTFNGNNHTISNLTINLPTTNYIGLFGDTSANSVISNVGLAGGSVSGSSYVGGLVGISNGTVSNSYATGSVSGTTNNIGGLAGLNYGSVSNSYSTGNVSGGNGSSGSGGSNATNGGNGGTLGGLVGYNAGAISNDYATGNVSGGNGGRGGDATTGRAGDGGNGGNVGGLVGYNAGTISNNYATGIVSGGWAGAGGNFDINSSGHGGQGGNSGNGGNVGGAVGYNAASASVSNSYATGSVSGGGNAGGGIGPCNLTVCYNSGFGKAGSIGSLGGLAGFNAGAISSDYAMGVVKAGSYGISGGLVGYNTGTVSNSYATGNVSNTNYGNVGGLVANNSASGVISNSYATGMVGNTSYGNVGGLVGSNAGKISSSYATGAVHSNSATNNGTSNGTSPSRLGGLVGLNTGSISNAYATGAVSSNYGNYGSVGGLVGKNPGKISNSYATGNIAANYNYGGSSVGGLVGDSAGGLISNSFYDKTINSTLTGVNGGTDVAGSYWGMSTSDMKLRVNFISATTANGNVNPNWDFTTPIWRIAPTANSGYPCLVWSASCVPPTTQIYLDLVPTSGSSYSSVYGSTPNISYVYDTSPTYSLAGVVSSSLVVPVGTPGSTGAPTATSNVSGSPYIVTPSISGITGVSSAYTLAAGNSVNWTITLAPLTISGVSGSSRTYNGSTIDALTGTATLVGLIGGQTFALNHATTGTLASANAGSEAVTTAITLGSGSNGALAGNYSLTQPTLANVTIAKAPLTVSTSNVSKTYDGTTAATGVDVVVTGTLYTNASNNNTADTLTGGTFAFSNKNAGGGNKTVTVSGITVSDGNGGNNYTVTEANNTTSTITPRALTITAAASSKTYDGTTASSATPTLTSGVIQSGDTLGTLTETFDSKNASATNGRTLSVGSYTLNDGNHGNNYTVTLATTTGTINPLSLTLTGSTGVSKTYDGTTSMPVGVTGYNALTGTISGDSVQVTGSPVFAGANAGTPAVLAGSTALTGADAGNYSLLWANGAGIINKAALTMTANAASKVLTASDPALTASYSGFVNGETAATAAGLTPSLSRAAGESAGNYTITPSGTATNYTITPVTGTFTIVPANELLISVNNASSVYGNSLPGFSTIGAEYYSSSGAALRTVTLMPTGSGNYTYSDGLGTTGSFNLATAATSTSGVGNYAITVSNFTKSGNNFTTEVTQSGVLTVSQRAATLSPNAYSRAYDGTTAITGATATVSNLVGSDTVSVTGSGSFTLNKNVGTNLGYTLNSLQLTGLQAADYYLPGPTLSGTNGAITARLLNWSVSNAGSTYGTTATPGSATLINAIAGDVLTNTVTVYNTGTSTVATFAARTAAGAYDEKVTAIGGADAGNYTLSTSGNTTGTLTIAPKAITLTADAISKVYDKTTAYTTQTSDVTAIASGAGIVAGDSLTGITLAYADANAGSSKTVQASAAAISNGASGSALGNYTITYAASQNGTITPKPISVGSAATASDKTYDGLTNAATSGGSLTGVLGGDTVNLGAVGSFVDPNAGTGKTVNLSYLLGGASAGNYSLTTTSGTTTATINPAPLSMTATSASKLLTETDPTFTASYNGFVNGETAAVLTNPTVTRSNVGTEAAATYTGVLVPSATSNNYAITPVNGDFTIVPAQTLLIQLSNQSMVYGASVPALNAGVISSVRYLAADGTTIQTITPSCTGSSCSGNDGLGSTFTFNLTTAATSASKVNNYSISVSGFNVTGGSNFSTEQFQNGSLAVTPVAVIPVATVSKVYDGTTATTGATLSVSNNVSGSDAVVLSGVGAYASKNVGTGLAYTFNNLALSGNDAYNYYLSSSLQSNGYAASNGIITALPLSVTYSGANKVYNGTTAATVNATPGNLVSGDSLFINSTAAFVNANAGIGKAINVSGVSLSGADAGNYSVASTGTATANIAPAPLVLTTGAVTKTYDGTLAATGTAIVDPNSGTQLYGTDSLSGGTFAFTDKNAGSGKSVTATGVTVSDGNSGGNYAVTYDNNINSIITPKSVTLTAPVVSKSYDVLTGYTANTTDLTALSAQLGVTGDTVSAATLGYTDPHAGTGKLAFLAATTVNDGNGGNNYTLNYASNSTSVITPATLTATLTNTGVTKTYDGTTAAPAGFTPTWTIGGLAGTDTASVTLGAGTQLYNNPNVTVATQVTVSGVALGGISSSFGSLVSDYTLPGSASVAATITPAPLTYTLSLQNPTKTFTATGQDLYTASTIGSLLNAVLNGVPVGGSAPGALSYTLWKNGVQVTAVNGAGTYEVKAGFNPADINYSINGAGNTVLSFVVNSAATLDNAITNATVVQPSSNVAPAQPVTPVAVVTQTAQNTSGGQVSSFVNVVTPSPQVITTFGNGAQLAIISSPAANEPTQIVSLTQAREMLQPVNNTTASNSGGTAQVPQSQDVRVPASSNSLVEIVNGGVRLPAGVEQELFVVKAE